MRNGSLLVLLVLALVGAVWFVLDHEVAPPSEDAPSGQADPSDEPGAPPAGAMAVAGDTDATTGKPRDVRITVVQGAQSEPVVGAIISVSGVDVSAPEPTNALGRTWIRLVPPRGGLRIDVSRADSATPPHSYVIAVGTRAFTVELPGIRRLTWLIEAPSPSEGAAIQVHAGNLGRTTTATIANGKISIVWGTGPFRGWAEAPDGSLATMSCSRRSDVGEPLRFLPSRVLTAHVRQLDGTPAVGYEVEARVESRRRAFRSATTDSSGQVVLRRLPPMGVELRVYYESFPVPAVGASVFVSAGTVDLSRGDQNWEVRVATPKCYRVTLAGIRNTDDLLGMSVHVDGQRASMSRPTGMSVIARWHAHDARPPGWVLVSVPGYKTKSLKAPPTQWSDPAELRVRFAPSHGAVWIVPAGWAVRAQVQQRGEDGLWQHVRDVRSGPQTRDPTSWNLAREFVVYDLSGGHYRIVDPKSLAASAGFDVVAGASPPTATVVVKHRVVDVHIELHDEHGTKVARPSGINPMEVTLRAHPTDEPLDTPSVIIGRARTKAWNASLTLPVGRSFRLTADHPTWKMSGDTPHVRIDAESGRVVVQLIKPAVHEIRLAGTWHKLPSTAPTLREIPILFWREVDGQAVDQQTGRARVVGDSAAFLAPAPHGVYEVFFDVAPFAPIHLRDIGFDGRPLGVRKAAGTYLPHRPQPLKAGGSIRFGPRDTKTLLVATARHRGIPSYVRRTPSKGALVLSGLGPGVFDVVVHAPGDTDKRAPVWSGTVESDGASERVVEFPR